jgi:hypothetical protein
MKIKIICQHSVVATMINVLKGQLVSLIYFDASINAGLIWKPFVSKNIYVQSLKHFLQKRFEKRIMCTRKTVIRRACRYQQGNQNP